MSFQDCFDRSPQDCTTDNECVLEFDANDQFPSCVPRLDWTFDTNMSDHEVELFKTLMVRLLPPAPHTESGKTRLIIALRELFEELKPMIDLKIRKLIERNKHTSWKSLVNEASIDVIHLMTYRCSICLSNLSDRDQGSGMISMPCCTHVFHRTCITGWLTRGTDEGRCAMCRTPVSDQTLNALDISRQSARTPLQQARDAARALAQQRAGARADQINPGASVALGVEPNASSRQEGIQSLITEKQSRIQQRVHETINQIMAGSTMRDADTSPQMIAVITFCVIATLVSKGLLID